MKGDKVALRYCGGCNPRYDRGQTVAQLQEECGELSLEPFEHGKRYCGVLVVCGCSARCAQQGDLPCQLPRCVIDSAQGYALGKNFLSSLKRG